MIFGLIIVIIIFYLISKSTDYKFDNRTSPNGYRTDWGAFNHDLANGMSQMDVKRKFNNGRYDIPDTLNSKYRK